MPGVRCGCCTFLHATTLRPFLLFDLFLHLLNGTNSSRAIVPIASATDVMTLAKHGLQYSAWSNGQLKDFASARKIKLRRKNRKSWIAQLRAKDQEAVVPFLHFPAEVKNIIYKELLTPKSDGNTPERFACHPAILSSCKEVYNEARELINTTITIPLDVILCTRRVCRDTTTYAYGICVRFNGRSII